MPPSPSPAEPDPDVALTLAYAPAAARPALAALFALDRRLGEAARRGGEPGLALIRLAWWRDALAALADRPPPAEPLLIELAAAGVDGEAAAAIAEGWSAIVEDPRAGAEEHGAARGGTLFGLAGAELAPGVTVPSGAGEGWALAAIGRGDLARPLLARALDARWPRALRPLGLRVALAAFDLDHRDAPRRRMLRVLRHILTGR